MKPKVFITRSGKRLEGKANRSNITTLTDKLPNTLILQPWKRYYSPWENTEVKAEVEEETPIYNRSIIDSILLLFVDISLRLVAKLFRVCMAIMKAVESMKPGVEQRKVPADIEQHSTKSA